MEAARSAAEAARTQRDWSRGREPAHGAPDRALRIVTGVAIAAGALITLGSLLNYFAFDSSVTDLDAGEEESLNNWLTVVGSFGAGLGALLLAISTPTHRRPLLAIAVIFAVISLDDLITLHERIGGNVGIDHIETAIFAPMYAYALFLVWRFSRETEGRVGSLLRGALVLLATAIVIDLGASITMDLAEEGTEWPQPTRIAFEEGFEVAGWTLMASVLLTVFCASLLAARPGERDEPHVVDEGRWWRLVALAAIGGGAAITLGGIFNYFVLDNGIPDLNVEREASLNNWLTVLGSFTAALGAALYSFLVPERRRLFLALAAAFLFMSIDDQLRFHERLAEELDAVVLDTAIFGPIYLAAFLMAWIAAPALGARAGLFLRAGVLLLGGAIAIDLGAFFTRDLADEGTEWPQRTRAATEEGFEVAGWVLIAAALALLPIAHRRIADRTPARTPGARGDPR